MNFSKKNKKNLRYMNLKYEIKIKTKQIINKKMLYTRVYNVNQLVQQDETLNYI